jgi:hypothetical protein
MYNSLVHRQLVTAYAQYWSKVVPTCSGGSNMIHADSDPLVNNRFRRQNYVMTAQGQGPGTRVPICVGAVLQYQEEA